MDREMRTLNSERTSNANNGSAARALRPVMEYLSGRLAHMERMRFQFRYRVLESRYLIDRMDGSMKASGTVTGGNWDIDVVDFLPGNVAVIRGACRIDPGEVLRVNGHPWGRVIRQVSFLIGDIVPTNGGEVALDHLFTSGLEDISRPEWDWEPLDANRDKGTLLLSGLPDRELLETSPNTVVVRRQMNAVSMMACNGSPHLDPLRAAISGEGWSWPSIRSNDDGEFIVLDTSRSGANAQMDMVDIAAATPDIAIMHGPPGSGKTTVLVELVARLVGRGERVLLVSSTHVAVDNVLERLMDAMVGDAPLLDAAGIMPLRVGHESRVSPRVRCLLQDRLVRDERARLLSNLESIDRDAPQEALYHHLSRDTGRTSSVEELVWRCSNLVCGTTQGVTASPLIQEGWGAEPQFDTVIIDEASKATLQEFLVPAVTGARWMVSGDLMQLSPYVDIEDMEAELHRARHGLLDDDESDMIVLAHRAALKGGGEVMDVTEDMLGKAREQLESYIGGDVTVWPERGRRVTLRPSDREKEKCVPCRQRSKWDSEVEWRLRRSFELRLDHLASDRYMAQVRSMLPAYDAERSRRLQERLDHLISVAMPSVMEVLTGKVEGYAGLPQDALVGREVTLRYQHRMHPRLSQVPRDVIYGGRALKDPPDMEQRRQWGYDGLPSPLTWVQVDCNLGFNNSNEAEARVTAAIVQDLVEWGVREGTYPSIAILTPYREQERSLREELSRIEIPEEIVRGLDTPTFELNICTVDRFQGHEADVVILSMVRGHRGTVGHMDSLNRLNVAITRARYQLVLVGDRRTAMAPSSPKALHALANSADVMECKQWS